MTQYFYIQRKNVIKVIINKKVAVVILIKMSLDKAKCFIKYKSDWIKR